MTHELDGVYAAIVTPFDADGRLLPEPMQTHLAVLERKGCDGVLVCGTTGEATSLTVAERIALVKAAVDAGTGLKVLAGTGAAGLEDTVELTRSAFDDGADAVVVLPPFFWREPNHEGVCLFYEQLIARAVPSDGRLLLYHNPVATITSISVELIRRLCDRFPDQVVGVKDSGSNLEHSHLLTRDFPQLRIFVGDDHHLSAHLAHGGAGAITGVGNIFPDLLRDVRDAHLTGSPTSDAQKRLDDAAARLDGIPRMAALKALLAAGRILPHAAVRPPLRPLTADEQALLDERFHLNERLPDKVNLADIVGPASD